jgi:hypothetical protein
VSENVDIYTRLHGAREAARGAEGVATGFDHVGDQAEQAGKQSRRGATGVDRFGRAAKSADKQGKRMARTFVSARTGVGGLRAGIVTTSAALFGGVGLISGVKLLYGEAREATLAGKATGAALESTGAKAWTSKKHIEGLAGSLSEMAGVDDEVIQKSENMLLTFRNIENGSRRGKKTFDRTTRAALDLSAGMTAAGKAMTPTDAALQLGKAVNDPVKGMTRLTRIGITFTKQQEKQVAAFTKQGKMHKAQAVILREVEKEFGGQAKSQADAGKKLSVIWHNVAEVLGMELLPYAKKGARWLGALGKDVGQILGDKNYSAADKFHQVLTRLFGDKTEQQIEHIIDDFRGMAHDLAPLVKLGGGLARAIGRFADKHPDIARVAVEIWAVHKALKFLGFGRAIGGARTLLGLLGRVGKTKAGAQAASALSTSLGAGPMGKIGSVAGRALVGAFGLAALAGVSYVAGRFADEFMRKIKDLVPEPFKSGIDITRFTNPLTQASALTGGGAGQFVDDTAGRGVTALGGVQLPYNPILTHPHAPNRSTRGHQGPTRRPKLTVPRGALNGETVIHHQTILDGKVLTDSVTRHVNADRNR